MDDQIKNLDKKEWPQTLLELPRNQIPQKLRIRGQRPDWSQKRICVIGSRKFSDYGRLACQKIIKNLCGYPITIVSGLAYGIDSIAHRFALENNLKTIAIPGSGLNDNVIYPKRHLDLAHQIIKNGGCLVSEFDDDQPAVNWIFPKRNRIMAGLSDLVLIIEASEKSGTMITARLALDYNIDVACLPGSIFAETSKGTNKLLKQGAQVITEANDVLEILKINPEINFKSQQTLNLLKLTEEQIKILNLLKQPLTKEELLAKIEIEIDVLNEILSVLEIEDLIEFSGTTICQK